MVDGIGNSQAAAAQAQEASASLLPANKDAKEAQDAPKFNEVWENIQAKYGARPEKPREIKKTLGKDDFLRIMITQMKHQDPTQPFKAEQFAAELAQYTSVEQLQNMNQTLTKMSSNNQPLERLAMTGLIGKVVTIDRERFPHTEGSATPVSFNLAKDAEKVEVSILAESGETILTKELGAMKAGENTFPWDGVKSNTIPAKSGNYIIRVEATGKQGERIQGSTKGRAKVVGVSFEGSEPFFLVGSLNSPQKISMRNVAKIESDGSEMIPGASSLAQAVQSVQEPVSAPAGAKSGGNFIAFQKGVGSGNVNEQNLSPEAKAALASYQARQAASTAASQPEQKGPAGTEGRQGSGAAPAPEEKGFPNGLRDSDESPTLEKGGNP